MSGLNFGFSGDSNQGVEFAWRDVLLNALLSIIILLILLLFQVNPPKEEESTDIESPGNVIVEITWPADRDCDLDLWVQAPGDTPVGYSAMSGKVFNLLRDDLGKYQDITDVNLENAYSRGIAEGEYCVNVHYFRGDNQGPVTAKVVVRTKENPDVPAKTVLSTDLELKGVGQEKTAFRFKLDKKGKLQEGSVHHIFKPLRSRNPGGDRDRPMPDVPDIEFED